MNLHEFQGKALFAEYNLPVSNGKVIYDANDALKACRDIGGSKWVVKARVFAFANHIARVVVGKAWLDTITNIVSQRQ